jgi:hypothetical protein
MLCEFNMNVDIGINIGEYVVKPARALLLSGVKH